MDQPIEYRSTAWLWLGRITHISLALAISFLPTVGLVAARVNTQSTPAPSRLRSRAALTQATSLDGNRAAAQRAFAEGQQLLKQETSQSRRQAIAKYLEALQLWRSVGDRDREANTLLNIGLVYNSLFEPQKALEYYNQALPLFHVLNNRLGEAATLTSIGGVYYYLGENQKALEYYNQALPLLRAAKARSLEAPTLVFIANVYVNLGEKQKALGYYYQALVIEQAEKNSIQEANTLDTIGTVYQSLGEKQKALESYNSGLALFRATNNRAGIAKTLSSIGDVYNSFGENQTALDYYYQSLPLFRADSNLEGEAITLSSIGSVYKSLSQNQKALDYYNQALALLRVTGNRYGQASTLNSIGLLYEQLGDYQKALDTYNSALELFRALNDRGRVAFTLNNIGGIYASLGDYQKALDTYNSALVLQRAVTERVGEATTLTYIASVYYSLGDYPLSINSYTQALSLFRAASNRTREARTLDDIGLVYRSQGENQKALEYYNQALSVERAQNNYFTEAVTLTNIVGVYDALGDYQNALDSSSQALLLWSAQKNSLGQAAALAQIGRVYRSLREYQKALDFYNRSLALFRAVEFRVGEAAAIPQLAKVYDLLGQPQQAIATYNQALSLSRALGDASGEAEALYGIALIERNRGNLNQALTQIEAAIKIVESLRTKVASQELRTSYFASVQKYYKFNIDLLMQLHKQNSKAGYDAAALQVNERARARSLVDLLTEANINIRQGVAPALLERERSLQQQINAYQSRLLNSSQSPVIKQELDSLVSQYQELQAQIRQSSPRYAALTQPQALTLAQIQQLLDRDTLLLEYSLGKERSYLWAVTPTSITSYELPKQEQIETAARQFYRDLTDIRRYAYIKQDLAKVLTNLGQMILGPVVSKLGHKRLLVVSDGALQYIPFAALPMPGAMPISNNTIPLLVEHEVVSSPSASTLAVVRRELIGRQPAAKTIAMFADPVFSASDLRVTSRTGSNQLVAPRLAQSSAARSISDVGITRANQALPRLPGTKQEAEQILTLVPNSKSQQNLGFAANLASATSRELSQYRLIHFATHGLLNSEHPELSGVVLSLVNQQGQPQDGFLDLTQVYNLKLRADLVVLSACQTGLGQEVQGEGLVGLTRGFMYAGTPRVVASLWEVDDAATAALMQRFYRVMLQQKLSASAALRAAQKEIWQQQGWSAPYYWGAFVLQGEWR